MTLCVRDADLRDLDLDHARARQLGMRFARAWVGSLLARALPTRSGSHAGRQASDPRASPRRVEPWPHCHSRDAVFGVRLAHGGGPHWTSLRGPSAWASGRLDSSRSRGVFAANSRANAFAS